MQNKGTGAQEEMLAWVYFSAEVAALLKPTAPHGLLIRGAVIALRAQIFRKYL